MNDARRRRRTRVSTYHRTTELDEIANTSRARNRSGGKDEYMPTATAFFLLERLRMRAQRAACIAIHGDKSLISLTTTQRRSTRRGV